MRECAKTHGSIISAPPVSFQFHLSPDLLFGLLFPLFLGYMFVEEREIDEGSVKKRMATATFLTTFLLYYRFLGTSF